MFTVCSHQSALDASGSIVFLLELTAQLWRSRRSGLVPDRLAQTAPRLAEALLVHALALAVGQVAFMDWFGALLWPLNNAH